MPPEVSRLVDTSLSRRKVLPYISHSIALVPAGLRHVPVEERYCGGRVRGV